MGQAYAIERNTPQNGVNATSKAEKLILKGGASMSRFAAVLLASAALVVAVGTPADVSQEAPAAGRTTAGDGFGWGKGQVVADDGFGWGSGSHVVADDGFGWGGPRGGAGQGAGLTVV